MSTGCRYELGVVARTLEDLERVAKKAGCHSRFRNR